MSHVENTVQGMMAKVQEFASTWAVVEALIVDALHTSATSLKALHALILDGDLHDVARLCDQLLAQQEQMVAVEPWKDHRTAALVNDLRDCAKTYGNTQQLRERIATIVAPLCAQLKTAELAAAQQGVHQIAEPAAPVGKPIEDAIDALVMAAFTEGGCSEHRMTEARIQTELRKKELRTLLSTPQPCSRSHPHEEMTPMCELRTEIARPTNALARAEAQLAAAPQAVQAAVPLFWVRLLRDGLYEGPVHNSSVGGKMLRDEKPGEWHPLYLHTAPAHPAEGVPAQAVPEIDERAAFDDFFRKHNRLHPDTDTTFRSDAAEPWKYWKARAALAATQPAAQGMEQDAARYRWLRNHGFHSASAELGSDLDGAPFVCFVMRVHIPEPISLPYEEQEWTACDTDVAIDAALAAQAKQGAQA